LRVSFEWRAKLARSPLEAIKKYVQFGSLSSSEEGLISRPADAAELEAGEARLAAPFVHPSSTAGQ
jgi:hypothetical protein